MSNVVNPDSECYKIWISSYALVQLLSDDVNSRGAAQAQIKQTRSRALNLKLSEHTIDVAAVARTLSNAG